jgi:hypothetical protein
MSKILEEMKAKYGGQKASPQPRSLAKKNFDIETDTSIMPDIVAESVCDEAARLLNVNSMDPGFIGYLVKYANEIYSHNPHFRKNIRSENNHGNAGRDYLYAFMRHWLASELIKSGFNRKILINSGFSMGAPADRPGRWGRPVK